MTQIIYISLWAYTFLSHIFTVEYMMNLFYLSSNANKYTAGLNLLVGLSWLHDNMWARQPAWLCYHCSYHWIAKRPFQFVEGQKQRCLWWLFLVRKLVMITTRFLNARANNSWEKNCINYKIDFLRRPDRAQELFQLQ